MGVTMSDAATSTDPSPWAGAPAEDVAQLLDDGRASGTVAMDDLMKVLEGVELTEERIDGIRTALTKEGIALDEDDHDDPIAVVPPVPVEKLLDPEDLVDLR